MMEKSSLGAGPEAPRVMETRSLAAQQVVHIFEAELALRRGNTDAAVHMLSRFPLAERAYLDVHFYSPITTTVSPLLAQNSGESRIQAGKWLQRLRRGAEMARQTPRLIEALALESLLEHAEGDDQAAPALAEKAAALAERAGMVCTLVDRGPRMARLLARLRARGMHAEFVATVLAADPATGTGEELRSVEHTVALNSLLTNREYDVLRLLASRLSNKEIAPQLVLSPKTIKRYTYNIYQKLGVGNRRQAVAKAAALGLLGPLPPGPV